MERFRDSMNRCCIWDLGYVGPRFTWNKVFANGDSWWVRLDKALAIPEWYSRFTNAKLHHLSTTASDHCMFALRWDQSGKQRTTSAKLFKCEATWLRDPREFVHVGHQIKTLQNKLQILEASPEHKMDNIQQVRQALNSWLDMEEIQGLEDDNGQWQEGLDNIEHAAMKYFSSLFTFSQRGEMTKLLSVVTPSVTDAMNQLLARDFQASEITQAIKQMHPHTAPGPDGFPPLFYQRFWSLTSNCVTQAAFDFLNHGIVLPNFNGTHIVLIPKNESGVEIVIRDHHGEVVAALSKKLQAPLGSLEVEAKVMEEAITFAWDMGI
ncbi:uncharacterized protein LOC142606335 [Castanea sativa]|uniref:uncharacterized protein LOC142606335 n=1 Tax=Castanea sativa TaxID=21020 RepID=UPI003F64A481